MSISRVSRVGAIAAEILSTAGTGKVIGVTSKGAFILSDKRILFITSADYLSPFNVTLENSGRLLESLQPGDKVSFGEGRLVFPASGLTLETASAEVWVPSAPVKILSSTREQQESAEGLIAQLRSIDPEKGYLFLSESLNNRETVLKQNTLRAARGVTGEYRKGNLAGFKNFSTRLLGSGSGLTPSGDDFLTGFILYHVRRLQSLEKPIEPLQHWCNELTELAFQKTTTISANRLQAAGRGWSEDLFLHLLNHLFDPSIPLDEMFTDMLMNFGHSSGVDTFMGMYFAVLSLQPSNE